MKTVKHFTEEELKGLIADAIVAVSPQPTTKVKSVKFNVIEGRDCFDNPSGGVSVRCEVEIEEIPG